MTSQTISAGGRPDSLESTSLLGHAPIIEEDVDDGCSACPKSDLANLLLMSLSFFLIFTPFNGILSIESTINDAQKLGVISLGVFFVAFTIACLLAPAVVVWLGNKATMVAASGFICLFAAAHFAPHWGTLIPASALAGVWMAFMNAAQCIYLTRIALNYSESQQTHMLAYLGLFNGVFYLFFQSSIVSGNAISAVLLRNGPSPAVLQLLFLVYVCCAMAGMVLLCFLLTQDHKRSMLENDNLSVGQSLSGIIRVVRRKEMLMLIPTAIFSGMELGFVASEFTHSYIRPFLGPAEIGVAMVVFGMTDAAGSLLLGLLSDAVGYGPVLALGGAAHGAAFLLLLAWPMEMGAYGLLYCIAALFGLGDAVWNTQLKAIAGAVFVDEQASAFSAVNMFQGAGSALIFFLDPFLTSKVEVYLLLGMLVLVGVGCFSLYASAVGAVLRALVRAPAVSLTIFFGKPGTEKKHSAAAFWRGVANAGQQVGGNHNRNVNIQRSDDGMGAAPASPRRPNGGNSVGSPPAGPVSAIWHLEGGLEALSNGGPLSDDDANLEDLE